jgi:nitrate/nitrite transport system substrate-binding protein
MGSLTGRLLAGPDGEADVLPDFHVFHRYAANFPWISHALWLLKQMARWRQIAAPADLTAVARQVYRPDLYREAARALGIAAPDVDVKVEGVHAGSWTLPSGRGAITMGSDLFFDGATFDPEAGTSEYGL